MGSIRPERELSRARGDYFLAVREAAAAMRRVEELDVPMLPRRGFELPPWTREQIEALVKVHQALGRVLSARRTYDRMVAADRARDLA